MKSLMTASVDAAIETLVRRDRLVVVTALTVVIALSWAYLLAGAGMGMSAFEMTRVAGVTIMSPPDWTPGHAVLMFFMWWVMMVAMMLPSAAPIILLTAALNRRSTSDHLPYGTTASFTIGYLLAWFVFSLVAVAGHLVLEYYGLLSSMMHSKSTYLTAGLLLAAGVWQFSPIKQACLRHCRSPVEFITRHRRPGTRAERNRTCSKKNQGAFQTS